MQNLGHKKKISKHREHYFFKIIIKKMASIYTNFMTLNDWLIKNCNMIG